MSQNIKLTESTIGSMKYLYYDMSASPSPSRPDHRDIIKENSNKLNLVPYTHQIPGGFETLCYELGEVHHGLIPLVHVFHTKRPIKLEELILLMHGIVATVLQGTKLELYESSFLLEPKHVYMKRNSTQPQLVYLPIQIETPLKVGFGQLVHYLSTAYDQTNPLTGQIITALKNIVTGNFSLRDIVTVVVQAANQQTVDKKFLVPSTDKPKAESKGLFKRLVSSVTGKEKTGGYDDPFEGFDERTVISMTDVSKINLNVAALYVMDGETCVFEIPITKDNFILGRNVNEVDHCFEEKGISRIHAVITVLGNEYTLTDKGSSGGTFVNGERLVSGQPVPLKDGDEIVLYKKRLRFEVAK
jgi:hypothetical protein